MALRSQSFNERRAAPSITRTRHSDGEFSDEADDAPANLAFQRKGTRKTEQQYLSSLISTLSPWPRVCLFALNLRNKMFLNNYLF